MMHNCERSAEGNTTMRTSVGNMRLANVAILLAFVLSLVSWSWGQGARGTIVGTVTDASGAVVANAAVTVTNMATNVAEHTKTSQVGD